METTRVYLGVYLGVMENEMETTNSIRRLAIRPMHCLLQLLATLTTSQTSAAKTKFGKFLGVIAEPRKHLCFRIQSSKDAIQPNCRRKNSQSVNDSVSGKGLPCMPQVIQSQYLEWNHWFGRAEHQLLQRSHQSRHPAKDKTAG